MRGPWLAFGLFLAVPMLYVSAAGSDATLVTDAEYDPEPGRFCFPAACTEHLDPRVDLVSLEVLDDDRTVTIVLETRDGPDVSLDPQQQVRTLVRFNASGMPWFLRADTEEGFSLWQAEHEGGALDDAEGYVGHDVSWALTLDEGAHPWSFRASFVKEALLVSGVTRVASLDDIRILASAMIQSEEGPPVQASATDLLPDAGTFKHSFFGGAFTAELQLAETLAWDVIESVDFAGGPSVHIARDGTVNVAYYVYDDSRKTPTGIYHATVREGQLQTVERVAPYEGSRTMRDHASRLSSAPAPGGSALLYAPAPATGWGWDLAVQSADGWTIHHPATELGLRDSDAVGDLAVLAASGDRLAMTLPLAGGGFAVVDIQGGEWRILQEFADSRQPRLTFDADGALHLAAMRGPATHGTLWYAKEPTWTRFDVVDGVEDRSVTWQTSETDGSYDLAIGPQGPCFAWDRHMRDRTADSPPQTGYACFVGDLLKTEPIPLVTVHGNIQLSLRLAFDGVGRAVLQSGYGGSDLLLVRDVDGQWTRSEVERRDVFDLAVTPQGEVWTAYTQPHGGTTLALARMHLDEVPSGWEREDEPASAPAELASQPLALTILALGMAMLQRRPA